MQAQSDVGTAFLNEINIIKGRDSVCCQPSSIDQKSFQMSDLLVREGNFSETIFKISMYLFYKQNEKQCGS